MAASIPDDIFFATITEINQKLKAKQFSVVELTKAFCDRLEKIGPRYNALALSLREPAIRAAKDVDGDIKRERFRGPLQGIPFGAKDLLAYAKHPTTWGARPYAGQVFDFDATVLKKIAKTGGILTGKLAMVELAGGPTYR
jgi:aspartyl-tRNA(Asn)/glutamyl-tRNA(Gln) amidotransferase subunit A